MPTPRKTKSKRTLTRAECAEELGVHEDTIKAYTRDGCPHDKGGRGKPNRYNPDEVAAWMQSHGKTGKPGRPSSGDSADIEEAKLREINLRCRKHEIAIARDEGALVPAEEVKQWIGQHVTAAKNKLIGLGASVTPQLEGRDAAERQTIIDARVTEILDDLAAA